MKHEAKLHEGDEVVEVLVKGADGHVNEAWVEPGAADNAKANKAGKAHKPE